MIILGARVAAIPLHRGRLFLYAVASLAAHVAAEPGAR